MEDHLAGLAEDSWLVSAGRPERPGAPLNVPLVPASTFLYGDGGAYSRDRGTPTWEALEEIVGGLEGGTSVAFASGMAAVSAVFDHLPQGASVVLPDDCYQGVSALVAAGMEKRGWSCERLALDDTESWVRACARADMVWLESPSNPLLTVADVPAICGAPRKAGAIVAVDNTFATPLNQRPLALGATVSMQSATKFIGGHSDLLAGIVTASDTALIEAVREARVLNGATPGALESFLATRGARTLALRLRRAEATAMALAERLEAHPLVARVRYPGLASHPTHEVARRTLRGFGAIISFDLEGDADFADRVCASTKLLRHTTSLGAVESTLERRSAISGQEHLPESFIRVSVGIEDPEDLWADLDGSIRAAGA